MYGNRADHSQVPTLNDYAAALRRWERTEPLRGDTSGLRPLAERSSKKAKWMRQHADGAIGCVHWSTEVVTYHPDNSITITSWRSKTTNDLVNRITPYDLKADFNSQLGPTVWLNWNGWHHEKDTLRGYLVPNNIRVWRDDGVWALHPDSVTPETIGDYRIDTHKARVALRATRYDEYVAWRKAFEAMLGDAEVHPRSYVPLVRHEMVAMLADQGEWQEMALRGTSDESVRLAVYAAAGDVVTCTDLPYLTSHKDVLPIRSRQLKYRWL